MPYGNPFLRPEDEYSTQNNVYGGAASNGQQGSQTQNSQTNAIAQQQPTGGGGGKTDPFSSFGSAAQQWAKVLTPQKQSKPDVEVQPYANNGSVGGNVGGYNQSSIPTPNLPNAALPGGGQFAPVIPNRNRAVAPGTNPSTGTGPVPDFSLANTSTGTAPPDLLTNHTVPYSPPAGQKPLHAGLPSGESWVNPVTKPADPNDLEGMAEYYRGFAGDPINGHPSFANITAADVGNYRMLAIDGKTNLSIGDWIKAGKPGGQWTPAPPQNQWTPDQSVPPGATDRAGNQIQTGAGGAGSGAGSGTGSVQYDRNGNPINGTGTGAGAGNPTNGSGGDLQSLMDYYKQLMGPMHQQEQEDYLRQLATVGGNSGAINSGAYYDAQSRGLSDLINNENAGIYGNLFTGSESAKDRALQKALAEITGSFGVQEAQLHASAAESAAAQSAGASKYNADLGYRQFEQELPYKDKWQGYNYQLGQDQLSAQQYQYLLSLMGGLTFPPSGLLPTLPQGGFFP